MKEERYSAAVGNAVTNTRDMVLFSFTNNRDRYVCITE